MADSKLIGKFLKTQVYRIPGQRGSGSGGMVGSMEGVVRAVQQTPKGVVKSCTIQLYSTWDAETLSACYRGPRLRLRTEEFDRANVIWRKKSIPVREFLL